jgi:hypothetical protein
MQETLPAILRHMTPAARNEAMARLGAARK